MQLKNKQQYETDWAFSEEKGKNIHISEAKSGLQGYRCIGCNTPMIANIQKKFPDRQSYFRHYATNIEKEKPECVRVNKEYREKLAKAIFNRLKYVNIPAIYKLPLKKDRKELAPMLIEEKKMVQAEFTMAGLTFYEDEEGFVQWSNSKEIKESHLLIKPDVTFFNINKEPILFIEFITNPKITPEKYQKLTRLGINTLSITIPAKSEAAIEQYLTISKNYKWVYHEKEANTEYIPVPRTYSEDIFSVTENETIVYEETFRCRQHQINELIRSINKCLQSEYYRRIEYDLHKKIQQVEEDSIREKQELGALEELYRKEALERNSKEEAEEGRKYNDLEERYLRKRKDLKRAIKTNRKSSRKRDNLEESIKRERRKIKSITCITEKLRKTRFIEEARMEEDIWGEFKSETEDVERKINSLQEELRTLQSDIRAQVDRERRSVCRDIEQLREEERNIEKTIWEEFREQVEFEESEIRRIEQEEETYEIDIRREFDYRIQTSYSKLPERIGKLFEIRRLSDDYVKAKSRGESYRAARELFNKGTWKTW